MYVRVQEWIWDWQCPDCGEVRDRIVEVHIANNPFGRWFDDGHFGQSKIDADELQFRICEGLSLPPDFIETVRSSQNRLRAHDPAFSEANLLLSFIEALAEEGHVLEWYQGYLSEQGVLR